MKKTCVEFCTNGFPSVFGSKRGFQVLIKKSRTPNVTGLRYVNIRQVFAAKTLKQIVSYDTPAVNFFFQSSALNSRTFDKYFVYFI